MSASPESFDSEGSDRSLPTASDRLAKLIAENQVIVFEAGFPDEEFPYVICSMWGAMPSNEIFVRLTNGVVSFVESVPSPLIFPTMADRVFGMDVVDSQVAVELADRMWAAHKRQLIIPGKK